MSLPVVYRAMQYRAASDLSRVPVDHAVDHRRLVHLCYVLAGAVVLFALYLAFSPKNPLVSAARVLWPWSSLPAPTRVHIEDVQPGNAVAFQGDRQVITAHVSGLRSGEEVSLLLSTADGQLVDDRIADDPHRRRRPLRHRASAGRRRDAARHALSCHRGRREDAAVQAGSPDRADDPRRPGRLRISALYRFAAPHGQRPRRHQGPGRNESHHPRHRRTWRSRMPPSTWAVGACKLCR